MAKAQLISISQAARLTGKARDTVIKAAAGLRSRRGKKNAKLPADKKAVRIIAIGNKLSFRFEIDQSYLPQLIGELQALLAEFPVVGESPRRT